MKVPGRLTLSGTMGSFDDQRRAGWNMCLEEIERLNKEETQPEVGETWFVQINQRVEVSKAKVIEITDKTIVLQDAEDLMVFGTDTGTRYVRNKITFLEKLEAAEFKPDYRASVEAIKFALSIDDGMDWLGYWNEGEFEICRREWPEAPDECYIGADPFFKPTEKSASEN